MLVTQPPALPQATNSLQKAMEAETPRSQEVSQEPATQAEPEKGVLDPAQALLAEKAKWERILRQQRRQIEAERKKIELERQKFTQPPQVSFEERFKKDPYSAMREIGMNSDEIAAMMLNAPSPEQQERLREKQEFEAIRKRQDELEERLKQETTQQYEQAKALIAKDATRTILNNPDKFETIAYLSKNGANIGQEVAGAIELYFKKTGDLLDLEETLSETEDLYLEQYIKGAEIKKVKEKLSHLFKPSVPVGAPDSQFQAPQKNQPQTLSNRMVPPSSAKSFSVRDRTQRAILIAQGINPDTGERR